MTSNEHQIANIVKIVSHLIQQDDIHSRGNIVGDKTIYAKEGLYVGDYNPNYDFFIKGRGCITGDVIIKGNLFYENAVGEASNKNYMDVTVKPNKSTGFRVRDDISAKGLIWDSQEEEFVIADEQFIENVKPRQPNFLCNLRFKNANFCNGYCKNIAIENSIIGLNQNIKIDSDIVLSGDFKIKGNIYSLLETLTIKSNIATKSIKVEGSIFVENSIEVGKDITCHHLNTLNIDCGDIKVRNIQLEGDIRIKGNCEIEDYFISLKGAEFRTGLEVKGSIYIGKNLIFTGEDSGIAFSNLCNIENASVSYINGKKILDEGDILVSKGSQELSNKYLGTNLNAKKFRICNMDSPIDEDDAVNKKYVDQFVIGCHILEPVKVASTENLDCLFANNHFQLMSKEMGRLTLDGIDAEIGDRILVKNQLTKTENGIYIVAAVGNRNQQWILQIAEDWEDIIKNRQKITPMVMIRYGIENGRKLFGMNLVYFSIWEIMGCEEFVKKGWGIYEKLLAKISK
jgi:hypothetical protein